MSHHQNPTNVHQMNRKIWPNSPPEPYRSYLTLNSEILSDLLYRRSNETASLCELDTLIFTTSFPLMTCTSAISGHVLGFFPADLLADGVLRRFPVRGGVCSSLLRRMTNFLEKKQQQKQDQGGETKRGEQNRKGFFDQLSKVLGFSFAA